jgi:hypothetical protein
MTPAQIHIAWAVERIQEEVDKAQAAQGRAAKRAENSVMMPDKLKPHRKRGEVIGLRKALALVQQAQKGIDKP